MKFNSVDPADVDFTDLQPLKKLIGNARIVQLGEQSHGDGTCFLTKTRLIKFLHQEMGFDVIAFESGLYDCDRAWRAFANGEAPLESAQQGVFGVWTGSRQTLPLWKYLAEKSQSDLPLQLAGFDCQFTASASRVHLPGELKQFVKDFEIAGFTNEQVESLIDEFNQLGAFQGSKHEPSVFEAAMSKLIDLTATLDGRDAESKKRIQFWHQFFVSTRSLARYRWAEGETAMEGVAKRDAQMAKNLLWLAEQRFPNRKIIVWAASFHLFRNADEVEVPSGIANYDDLEPMGHLVHKALSDDVFSIGFTASHGSAGSWMRAPFPLEPAPSGTLEDLFVRAKIDNGWLQLDSQQPGSEWLGEKLFARPMGYTWMKASWGNHFDAMVFNKVMEPSRR